MKQNISPLAAISITSSSERGTVGHMPHLTYSDILTSFSLSMFYAVNHVFYEVMGATDLFDTEDTVLFKYTHTRAHMIFLPLLLFAVW